MHDYQTLKIEEIGTGVLLVTLNRPDVVNAITFEMFAEFSRLCSEVDKDPAARVLILTGSGRGFCSGLDLSLVDSLGSMSVAEMLAGQESWAESVAAFRNLSKPVIAAVNGPAAGAGMALALAADMRLAVPATKFNAAFVKVGLSGGDVGVSWMLPRIVGMGHASEIMMTGRLVDAGHAERIGLVNRVVDAEELLDAALELAFEIAANSPFGIRLTKRVLQANVDAPSLEAALELENRNQVLCTRTEDMAEALSAFREKREPQFRGQ